MSTSSTVRRMQFDFERPIELLRCAGPPEESCFLVDLSLLLPYLEPYLIRSMNAARPHIAEPALLADLEGFNGREALYCRQHRAFNSAVCASGFPALAAFEAELAADYQRFSETRSLRFNLAYAEGFEALTMSASRFFLGRMHVFSPMVRDLYEWHFLEELEHRTVAFEVYNHVCGGWWYRVGVGAYAQGHMMLWCLRVTRSLLLAHEVELKRSYGGAWGAARRLLTMWVTYTWHVLPKIWWTFLPWYSPRQIPMPGEALVLAARYDQPGANPTISRSGS